MKNIKLVIVGEPGYPPGAGRKLVDTRRTVEACDTKDCWEIATQMHGTLEHPIYTCDKHAAAVMMELMGFLTDAD